MPAAPEKSNPGKTPTGPELKVVKGSELSSDVPGPGDAANESLDEADKQLVTDAKDAVNGDAVNGKAVKPASENIVLSSVRELTSLYTSIEELRSELRARGIQGQSSHVMVEMAFNNRQAEMQGLVEAALESSQNAYGHGAITREELHEALDSLLVLEKDVAYTRKLCKQRGLDLQVLNFLTQIVRKNPGDGGAKAVNTFLGYASACNIELSGIDQVKQKYTTEPASVLPDIERPVDERQNFWEHAVVRDVLIGFVLTIGLMALIA